MQQGKMNSLQLLPIRVHWALPMLPITSDRIRETDTTPTLIRSICHDLHFWRGEMHRNLGPEKGVVFPNGQKAKKLGVLGKGKV